MELQFSQPGANGSEIVVAKLLAQHGEKCREPMRVERVGLRVGNLAQFAQDGDEQSHDFDRAVQGGRWIVTGKTPVTLAFTLGGPRAFSIA